MPPSTNHLFAGNGRRRYKTKQYAAWIEESGHELDRQSPTPIKGRVTLLIEVSNRESASNWDVCNREKAAVDLLVARGIIEGDNRRFLGEVTLRWADVSGIRITITQFRNIAPQNEVSTSDLLSHLRSKIRPMNIPRLESRK
jgi:Holliday junction resolvase RusA-like endonuclease